MRTQSEVSKQPSDNDGYITNINTSGTWATAVGESAGSAVTEGGASIRVQTRKQSSTWTLNRGYMNWDLSDIGIPRHGLKIISAKLVLRCTSVSAADTSGDIVKLFKANVDHNGSDTNLATGDLDQYSSTIKSKNEVQVAATGEINVPIDGPLLSYLGDRARAGGEFSVFILGKLDYDSGNQSDPAGLNRLFFASDTHSTSAFRPRIVIRYMNKRHQRTRRKGGSCGGFGELHIPSNGISGFSGER
jgi:hypothetical protein